MGRAGMHFFPKEYLHNEWIHIYWRFRRTLIWHVCFKWVPNIYARWGTLPQVAKVMKWLNNGITVLDRPGNSHILNSIENCWNHLKHKISVKNISSDPGLMTEIKLLLVSMDPEYFKSFSENVPENGSWKCSWKQWQHR